MRAAAAVLGVGPLPHHERGGAQAGLAVDRPPGELAGWRLRWALLRPHAARAILQYIRYSHVLWSGSGDMRTGTVRSAVALCCPIK